MPARWDHLAADLEGLSAPERNFMRNWGEFSVFAENDDYRLAPTKGRRQRVKAQANEMEARGLIRRASNWSGRLQEGKLGEMKRPR